MVTEIDKNGWKRLQRDDGSLVPFNDPGRWKDPNTGEIFAEGERGFVEGAIPLWDMSDKGEGGGITRGALTLDRYDTEDTQVPLSEGDKEAIQLARDLLSGNVGNFREMLEGRNALGHAESLINIGRRDLKERVLPEIQDRFSGPSYTTGARVAAEEDAMLANFEQNQQIRAQAYQQSTQEQLMAMGMVPEMAQVISQERTNNILNKEREIATFYKNQGLSIEEFDADMDVASLALEEAKLDLQKDMFAYQVQQAEEEKKRAENSGLFGSLGSILGAGAGMLLAPATGGLSLAMGASLGSQIGGGLGLMAGGSPSAGYQTLAQAPSTYMNYKMMGDLFGGGNRGNVLSSSMYAPSTYTTGNPYVRDAYSSIYE